MKSSNQTFAAGLSIVAIILLSATALTAGWSPGNLMDASVRVLSGMTSAARFGLGGTQSPATVTATKAASIVSDVDSDGKADPGDTIRYSVEVSVSAAASATGVHVTDQLDANTTLVPGSISVTPVTADDAYISVGNMTLTSASIAANCAGNPLRSVTCNDTLYDATVVGFGPLQASANGTLVNGVNKVTTASGSTFALSTDGTFVYEPAAGYEGADEFWYTVSGGAGTDVSKATVLVGSTVPNSVNQTNKMVWFVSVAGGGNGTQARPLTLAALAAINNAAGVNPNNGDTLYLLEGTHASGFSLRANQKLIGQDATVSVPTLGGPAVEPGNTYPAINPTATVVNTNSISLNGGNTIAGFTAGNSSTAMSGSTSGTLSVRDVVLNGNSRALTLTNATAVADATFTGFTSISSASGTTGIQLSAVSGTLNLGGGLMSGNTGVSFVVVGGNATINYGGVIQNSGSRQVSISNKTGGAVNFTGAITGTGTGIFMDNNDLGSPGVASMTFSGGLSIVAMTATNGGFINVCDKNPCGTGTAVVNVLSSPTATVLNVSATSIGANGMTFRSLSSGNTGSSIATGITLSGTGTLGGLTVTGNGTAGSGGTIKLKTGADSTVTQGTGISLINTAGASFAWMQLNGFSNHAIRGTNVTGLTLSNMVINGINGTTTSGQREGAVHIDGLFTTGTFAAAQTASISDSTIGGIAAGDASLTDNLRIVNTSGTLDRLTISNSTFGTVGSAGFNGVHFSVQNAATMKVTVSGSTFTSALDALLRADTSGNATLDLVARTNSFTNANGSAVSAGGLVIAGDTVGVGATVTYDISCNSVRDSKRAAIAVLKGSGNGQWAGSIVNNAVGVADTANSGSTTDSGIHVTSDGTGSHTVLVANNTVNHTNLNGIRLTAADSQAPLNGGQGVMNATVFGNVAGNAGSSQVAGLRVEAGSGAGDTNVINVVVGSATDPALQNDFSTGHPSGGNDVQFAVAGTAAINLSKNGSTGDTAGAVIDENNLNPATTDTSTAGSITLVSSMPSTPAAVASCSQVARLDSLDTMPRAVVARATSGAAGSGNSSFARTPAPRASLSAVMTSRIRVAVVTVLGRSGNALQTGASSLWSGVRGLTAMAGNALIAPVEAAMQPPAVDVDLGTIAAGTTITVYFNVTVNAPRAAQYTNQATVSGSNFTDVATNTVTTPGDGPAGLSIAAATIVEGTSGTIIAGLDVTLSDVSAETITVQYVTRQGTAIAGVDFSPTGGTLTFAPGITTQTVLVTIVSDAIVEIDEEATVELSSPTNTMVLEGSGRLTIIDDDATADRRAALAVWTSPIGVNAPPATLTKTAAVGWNAGAASAQALIGDDGWMEFTATEASTIRIAGLSTGNTNTGFADIDFGFYLDAQTNLYVIEGGLIRGRFGTYAPADRFAVAIESGAVVYRRNGILVYTSTQAPTYPLLVDTALFTAASTVTDVVISGRLARPIIWTNLVGVSVTGRTLTRSGIPNWNAGAASTRALLSGDGYVEAIASETTTTRMFGLSRDNSGFDWTDIDFGLYMHSNATLYIVEGGVSRGTFGPYALGDTLRVGIESGQVVYRRNGAVLHTSAVAPIYPLLVDTALFSAGATLTDVVIAGTVATDAAFAGAVGTSVVGNTLTKTAALGWNAAAFSTRALVKGDGFAEFTTSEATTSKIAGLSHGNTNTAFEDIDFGVLMASNGSFYVFESGVTAGVAGSYVAGDRFRVAVEGGVVKYRRNGVLFHTSALVPVYPLLVDTALYSPAATIGDVVLAGDLGELVTWSSAQGVAAASGALTKTGAAGWNSGAVSTRAIASGDGFVAFGTGEGTTHKLIGLSVGNTSTAFEEVDFAILLAANSTYYVFEDGVSRGVFGGHAATDRFAVAVDGGVVKYLRNGAVFYTSLVPPSYPLLIDTALFTTGATLTDVLLGCVSAVCQ
jgi:uncharacterized repeat protein (TIGR01451 family)